MHSGDICKAYAFHTIVIGSGAAGYNCAERLCHYGQKSLAILTENRLAGTSRNAGSDKQTYYKLSLCADEKDSIRAMAETLFQGGCIDGETALCEASLSAPCFFRLCEAGVPFPTTEFGEYVGYRTDHDSTRRATSVGPYTSKLMTQCLEAAVQEKGIPIFDHMQAVRILKDESGAVTGVACIEADGERPQFQVFFCRNLVLATGGPAGIYHHSVYPASQFGASGLAFEAGAYGKNLTEWQYGLASLAPRWNVSGSYMQVLPRFLSTDAQGGDEREFLLDFFKEDRRALLGAVFLKGYQWPFDAGKLSGSSVIDLLVYTECFLKGRRVFLDFTKNPGGGGLDHENLPQEAARYLGDTGALLPTPIERLQKMNRPAYEFYLEHGVDLVRTRLEISVCAQHNNGGIAVDSHWQTSVPGLFAIGEAAGTHGVHRPGGSALNAGQVGGVRAAQFIAAQKNAKPQDATLLLPRYQSEIGEVMALAERTKSAQSNVRKLYHHIAFQMSTCGGAIRNSVQMKSLCKEIESILSAFCNTVTYSEAEEAPFVYRFRDMLITSLAYLNAMLDYVGHGGESRGGALYTDVLGGVLPAEGLPDIFRCRVTGTHLFDRVQELKLDGLMPIISWRAVREIPACDYVFENVWRKVQQKKQEQ